MFTVTHKNTPNYLTCAFKRLVTPVTLVSYKNCIMENYCIMENLKKIGRK